MDLNNQNQPVVSITEAMSQLLQNMDKKHKTVVDFASQLISKLKVHDHLWNSQRDGSPQFNVYINGMEPLLNIDKIAIEGVKLTEILGVQAEQLKTAFDFLAIVQKKYKGTGFEIKLQSQTEQGLFDGVLTGVTPHRGFITFSGKILGRHQVQVSGNFQPTKAMLGISNVNTGMQIGASVPSASVGVDLSSFGSF